MRACRNMEDTHIFCNISIILLLFLHLALSDIEYMVTIPEPISLPLGFETLLPCEMNIEPDGFQWKFYPTDDPYNPNAISNLSNATFHIVSEEKYVKQRKKSILRLQVNSTNIAGEYQCLAYYGAYVVASVPWRLTIAMFNDFPKQDDVNIIVSVGNTVAWRCLPPLSNPEAYIDYYKNEKYTAPPFPKAQIKSLILPNVSVDESGTYKCSASNIMKNVNSNTRFNLKVVKYIPSKSPYFIIKPKSVYTVLKGDTVFLVCSAIGQPVPQVVWFKKNGQLSSVRIEMLNGGLKIKNVTSSDEGIYVCNHTNIHGTISHHITLIYNEEPNIECLMNSTDIKQGQNLDLDCVITGIPEPHIIWFLNGFSISNDSAVEVIENKIYFRPVEKRHAGNLQLFARNKVKTVYTSITVRVIPLSSSVGTSVTPIHTHHRHKGKSSSTRKPPKHSKTPKMIPPSKPVISRLNDESVVVRWNVPNNNGLPILFFKVQYRELGPANSNDHNRNKGWKTTNADIAPNIKVYDITNLKPDHIYKFRIAAVYSNNDNKLSPNSDKFHLRRLDFDDKNPLPIPLITRAETVNSTSVEVSWEYSKSENVSVDGFYISYMSASTAGDYMKATVDGESTTQYVITHLQPDTIYDIKLQSFNSKFASAFSPIMNARTASNLTITTTVATLSISRGQTASFSNIYIIAAGIVVGCTILICGTVLFFICRKWQRNKTDNHDKDKETAENHHIQAEANEYIKYSPKSVPKSNGCLPPGNRITITPNPLADADNKNQNTIEMSRLTGQNNNRASGQRESSCGSTSDREIASELKKEKNKQKSDKNKSGEVSAETASSGKNYV